MEKQYNHSQVEKTIYSQWMDKKFFTGNTASEKTPYSIVIPPPNITGILHMGHALNNTIQDIVIRYKRMSGFEALWIPGTDHAGIATQNVVEKQIAKQGKTRHDFGREAFLDQVWKWKYEHHASISNQLKRLGCSCDWDRERFTMDEGLSQAVRTVFTKLYSDGLIYRGKRIINWCPRCRTALSDEESEHKELKGELWFFRYPLLDSSDSITIATTRPETMLGDAAVAVNPTDERYTNLIGKYILLPLTSRKIPIIADAVVDKTFGSGAVKVTPAHDPHDSEIAQRHNLQYIEIMTEQATMCGPIPDKYKGLDRYKCRKEIVMDMQHLNLIEKIEEHNNAVGHCYRCSTVVEPFYSDQWFVRMQPLAQKALQAALDNKISFYPSRWKKTYVDWMENIRDWCISRQIWWGHRIPVWYCRECNTTIVSEGTPTECHRCKSTQLRQDEDVLDTWFSSWLWPFSTMGWPHETELLRTFYPTNTLATAPEIIFFWVSRMIMAGLYCTGKLPFTHIILHGTVRDKTGKKMSKSLGNSIDPLTIVDQYGCDALRFSLIMITAQGADVYLEKNTFEIGRNFANKLWNAARFLLSNIESPISFNALPDVQKLKAEDIWILSKLQGCISQITASLESFRFNDACHCIYDFTWHDFCDWYIEAKKNDLYHALEPDTKNNALHICSFLLGTILKLLHPVMPFITEEIWQHLRKKVTFPSLLNNEFIIGAPFPTVDSTLIHTSLEEKFELLKEIVTALRTISAENNIPPDKKGSAVIIPAEQEFEAWLQHQVSLINTYCKLEKTIVSCTAPKPSFASQHVVRSNHVFLQLEGLLDKKVEIERISKEIEHFKNLAAASEAWLKNTDFISKAPSQVIEKQRQKYEGIKNNLEKLHSSLNFLTTSE